MPAGQQHSTFMKCNVINSIININKSKNKIFYESSALLPQLIKCFFLTLYFTRADEKGARDILWFPHYIDKTGYSNLKKTAVTCLRSLLIPPPVVCHYTTAFSKTNVAYKVYIAANVD